VAINVPRGAVHRAYQIFEFGSERHIWEFE